MRVEVSDEVFTHKKLIDDKLEAKDAASKDAEKAEKE